MPCTYSNSDSMCNDFAYIYYLPPLCRLLTNYQKNNKELRDKIKNNYGKSL